MKVNVGVPADLLSHLVEMTLGTHQDIEGTEAGTKYIFSQRNFMWQLKI
jgi:hypothetical protein